MVSNAALQSNKTSTEISSSSDAIRSFGTLTSAVSAMMYSKYCQETLKQICCEERSKEC